MRFKIINDFYYKGKKKRKGTILNVAVDLIDKLKTMNVLGEPVTKEDVERAVIEPEESR